MISEKELQNLIEVEISNQGFLNNGWELLKKYKNENNNYYALIKCINCEDTKIVNFYNFINGTQRKCPKCRYYDLIGSTIGSTEILDVDHIDYILRDSGKKTEYRVYYKTKCVVCGKEQVKLYNKTNWLTYKSCARCIASFDNSILNRSKNAYKYNAKTRNLSWNLSDEQFFQLVTSSCKYCGSKPEYKNKDVAINGIDRINSNLGYEMSNCVPCCKKCNVMKLNYSSKEFLQHIKKIYNFQFKKQGSTTIESTLINNGSE